MFAVLVHAQVEFARQGRGLLLEGHLECVETTRGEWRGGHFQVLEHRMAGTWRERFGPL